MKKEIKCFGFKLDSLEDSGEFTGYASTFGNVDLGGDIVVKGAFKKTLRENGGKVPILDHHNPAKQVGWNVEAREDDRGLFVRGRLDLNVSIARERHSLMKMGNEVGGRSGLSIGFRTIKEEPDKANPQIRLLKEVQLFEYSVVTFPMNPEAEVTSVKARQSLIEQFLRDEIQLEETSLKKAVQYLQSLIYPEPDPHSGLKQLEPLLHSAKRLLTTIQT